MPSFDHIEKALRERDAIGRRRELREITPLENGYVLVEGKKMLNLCSNDYLGLSMDSRLKEAASQAVYKYGTGSTASRLVSGSHDYHGELEQGLATWLQREAVLVFNSGFQLNVSLIATLADKNTNLFFDKRNHNSLLQGALLSGAKLHRYRHNDYAHLEALLEKHAHPGTKNIIATETVFSMDGDTADLSRISELSDKYQASLIADEAHAIGVCGSAGRGFSFGNGSVDLVIGTFGKAFGSFGAFVAGDNKVIDYLINYCSGFIYTTALPASVIGATTGALKLLPQMDDQRAYLNEISAWFRNELKKLGADTCGSDSHIVPVVIGSDQDATRVSRQMMESGFLVQAIRPPTVEEGRSRLRFTLNVNNTKKQLHQVLEVLQKALSSNYEIDTDSRDH